MKHFLEDFCRSAQKINCKQVGEEFLEQKIVVTGWVTRQRDHNHFVFLDIQDTTGTVQAFLKQSQKISLHSVVAVKGLLLKRPKGAENKKIKTGDFEIKIEDIKVLSESQPLPVDIEDEKVKDSLKLKYRYLYLRSPRLQSYLKTRNDITHIVRQTLRAENFLEIETPILYRTTPEGARDYLVPSRIHKNQFYSLVQSPQILKQLLMVGGIPRYFQLAKCFRDEDLRSDRQPEFTQIDLEMSFVDTADVLALNEKLIHALWKGMKGTTPQIEKMSFDFALEHYGTDKPDLRIPLKLKSLNSWANNNKLMLFEKVLAEKGQIKSLALPENKTLSRSALDRLTQKMKALGAGGLLYLIQEDSKIKSPIKQPQDILNSLYTEAGGHHKSLVFIIAGEETIVNLCFASLIPEIAKMFSLKDESQDRLVWITDFPLFEWSQGKISSPHHPFTAPEISDLKKNLSTEELLKLKAKAYDLVCNGYELAGGSIRNHDSKIQKWIFQTLDLNPEEINKQFGFFIEALSYGTPPHGGIAWGLDRLVMILSGTEDIRDVMAFPKTLQASCLMSEAPSFVSEERLDDLGLVLKESLE